MTTWICDNDSISPTEVQAFMNGVRELFSSGLFPAYVRSVRRSENTGQGAMLTIELSSPAELVNDDDMVLAVLEAFYVPASPDEKSKALAA